MSWAYNLDRNDSRESQKPGLETRSSIELLHDRKKDFPRNRLNINPSENVDAMTHNMILSSGLPVMQLISKSQANYQDFVKPLTEFEITSAFERIKVHKFLLPIPWMLSILPYCGCWRNPGLYARIQRMVASLFSVEFATSASLFSFQPLKNISFMVFECLLVIVNS